MLSNKKYEGGQGLMKYIFFLIVIFVLQVGSSAEEDRSQENKLTDQLNKEPSAPIITTANDNLPVALNHLKILTLLQRLENILKEKKDVTLPEFLPVRALRSGDKDDSIVALRQILQSLGYLEKVTDSPFFDMELEIAIKAFQAGHCLEADGIIGDTTKVRLNWSYAKRLKMISDSISKIKNLVFIDRTVIINIPTYSLYAYEDQKLKMSMKAIVGRAKRPTPLMTSYIDAIEYNPVWVVPHTILFEDKLPKVQEDPKFLEKNKLKIFDRNDNEVDPSAVDWNEVDVNDFPYIFKQDAGKDNALGLIKFNLQNNEDIYMQDTPHQELFKKYSRALSSGCIRLEQPGKLASWLLNMDKDAVKEKIDTGETKVQSLKSLAAVHITYIPVWIDEELGDGRVLWGDDPYNLEPKPFY